MLNIGLTGGIGSGKSIVAQIFKTLGIPVLDADSLAKSIMQEDENVKEQLIKQFGPETYTQEGLNRAYIANIVFKDPFQLQVLNSIVHPATIDAGKNGLPNRTPPISLKKPHCFSNLGLPMKWISSLGYMHQTLCVYRE